LGHVVSDEGIKVDPNKIVAFIEWPSPKSITSLRGFLGLTGYYKIFIRNYVQIVAPLTRLLKTIHLNGMTRLKLVLEG
jgi:hypothetical protein